MKRSLEFHPTSKFSTPPGTSKPRCRDEFLAAQYAELSLAGGLAGFI